MDATTTAASSGKDHANDAQAMITILQELGADHETIIAAVVGLFTGLVLAPAPYKPDSRRN